MQQLYQEVLKAHYTSPIGLNKSIDETHVAEGYNATCGDEITIKLTINDKDLSIKDIAFESDSCAICNASASILCQQILDEDTSSLNNYYQQLKSKLEDKPSPTIDFHFPKELRSLIAVNAYPTRINCALLPWQTAIDALSSTKLNKNGGCSNV